MQEHIRYSFTADTTGAVAGQQFNFVLGSAPSVVPTGWVTRYKAILTGPAVNTTNNAAVLPSVRVALDFGAGPIPPGVESGRSIDLALWSGSAVANAGVFESSSGATGTWGTNVTPAFQLGGNILPGAAGPQVEGTVSAVSAMIPKFLLPSHPGMRAWATLVYTVATLTPVTSAQWALDLDVWIDSEQV